jgi:hypothetical protein
MMLKRVGIHLTAPDNEAVALKIAVCTHIGDVAIIQAVVRAIVSVV